MSTILVNATALRIGGGLSILHQFIDFTHYSVNHYVIFVYPGLSLHSQGNCEFVQIDKISWLDRVLWDINGVNEWIKKDGRDFSMVISLQNTSIKSSLKQIVYVHQALPYCKHNWNLLKKSEAKLFFYKKFYKFFINAFIKNNDVVVVQSDWLKDIIETENKELVVKVFRPSVDKLIPEYKSEENSELTVLSEKYLFYPSSIFSYKNHLFLLDVINKLSSDKFYLVVTFNKGDYELFDSKVKTLELEDDIYYSGYLSREDIARFYDKSHTVIFPSEIETFGLPLLEAAGLGKNLICSDLPYAHDVIDGYQGVEFVKNKDVHRWRNSILACLNEERKSFSAFQQNSDSWREFFNYIDGIKNV